MKEPSLKQILLDYINKTKGYITKGQLGLIAEQNGYLPEGAGRILRKMAEEEKILVDYYKGKRNQTLSRYARLGGPKPLPSKPKVEIVVGEDGILLARVIN